ncbi:hypothetical protein G6011_09421 [Alternaria panax]|uniref:DUF7730 domain-containing protein n=1 Tax=Alternaria panax TaxID=48097 RepID=A0AAD4NP13_9PLEO|nr:hypothetical protein G6011_09421 [Alternaria panax]
MADVEHRIRFRRARRSKRSVLFDGKRWWNRKAKTQSQSLFLAKLPVELRLQIYEMVLGEQDEFAINFTEDEPWDCWNVRADSGCDLNVLRTCKRIYREAVTVLYSRHAFRFDSYDTLATFASTIRPQLLACIRKVVLSVTLFWYRHDGFTMQYEELLTLLSGLGGVTEVLLRYRLRENNYVEHPRLGDFMLLEQLEEEERPREYTMFYEMSEVQTGPEIGGMLFDRWVVGERRKIEMKK